MLKALRATDKPVEVRDTRHKGFLLRVQPSGIMTYYAEFGRGQRVRIGRADVMKADAARAKAIEVLAAAHAGDDPRAKMKKENARNFREYIQKVYKPWAEGHIKRPDETVTRLLNLFPDFQTKRLDQITAFDIERWRSDRVREGAGASTVNRYLDDLKSCLEKAVGWGYLKANPAKDIKRLKNTADPTPRYLSEGEYRALVDALDAREARIKEQRANANAWRRERGRELLLDLHNAPYADYLKPLVLLSINTGLRRAEALALEWDAIDFDRSILTVRAATAKSSKTRHIPLNGPTKDMLAAWKDWTGNRYVFEGPAGGPMHDVRTAWEGVLKSAGIKNFRWHDLRHTFASWLVIKGVDLNTVRELMGHADYATTLRYAHLAPEVKAAAVERLVG